MLCFIKHVLPTEADGMVLISFSKSGLDQMIGICHSYATEWRFEYNINKCAVVISHGNNSVGERLFSMGR